MKKELLSTLKKVHKSDIGRFGQEDPTTGQLVPPGIYDLDIDIRENILDIEGARPYLAVVFKSDDAIYPVGLRKFRGYGTVGKALMQVVKTPAIQGNLADWLAAGRKVRVVSNESVEVDRYQPANGESQTVKATYAVWELVTPVAP
jgi:hypothetical protein